MKIEVTDIEHFLVVQEPSYIRQYVVCSLIFLILPSLLAMICDPFIPCLFNLFLAITFVMSIFSLIILFNAVRYQILYSLYTGIISLAISIVYYLCFYKLVFIALKINTPIIKYSSIIIYVALIMAVFILPFHFIKKGYYSSNRKISERSQKINSNAAGIIGCTTGLGLSLGRFLTDYGSYNTILFGSGIACLILSLCIILGIPNIHKYFIMKKFINYVSLYQEEKSDTI